MGKLMYTYSYIGKSGRYTTKVKGVEYLVGLVIEL